MYSHLLGGWREEGHEFEASLGKVREILSQKQNTKRGLGQGTSSRVLAKHAQGPVFSLQYWGKFRWHLYSSALMVLLRPLIPAIQRFIATYK
jgi:hypothetical protein